MGIFKKVKEAIAENKIKKGEAIWRELDEALPRPVGATENDQERIALFTKKAAKLSKGQLQALKTFMQQQIKFYTEEPEFDSERVFAHFAKWRQIYQMHLEAVS